MQLWINISQDKVFLACGEERIFLERNGIEDILGETLVTLYRKYQFSEAYILNGPWGFTNLRVGSLCLNLLNALEDNQISFFSFSKTELYQYAYFQKKVPQYGVLYIGQKRNVWLWDFDENKQIGQFSFESLSEYFEKRRKQNYQYFLDMTYEVWYYPEEFDSQYAIDGEQLFQLMQDFVKEKGKNLTPSHEVQAQYLMNPIITPTKKHFIHH